MEAVGISETSVNFYQTAWCNILEDISTLRMRTEMVLETLVSSPFNQLTRLVALKDFFFVAVKAPDHTSQKTVLFILAAMRS
jgi:hypothetical protein